jgi:hypothetical protein
VPRPPTFLFSILTDRFLKTLKLFSDEWRAEPGISSLPPKKRQEQWAGDPSKEHANNHGLAPCVPDV